MCISQNFFYLMSYYRSTHTIQTIILLALAILSLLFLSHMLTDLVDVSSHMICISIISEVTRLQACDHGMLKGLISGRAVPYRAVSFNSRLVSLKQVVSNIFCKQGETRSLTSRWGSAVPDASVYLSTSVPFDMVWNRYLMHIGMNPLPYYYLIPKSFLKIFQNFPNFASSQTRSARPDLHMSILLTHSS
ncbi:hypothetical protein BJ875DRAFT_59605 [Amylocarpus encephaloides]|uniref:Uncharacterized protein n=1 Tax=Amylocarpus encephaloides TaxID=45428 RepID=A0A9P8C3X1_9HELO|nr:hypothetical protein BJ875DRAFT_59605 [Amylocarpus encephaloides]